jgi:mono/diheme cytochrome c family protein
MLLKTYAACSQVVGCAFLLSMALFAQQSHIDGLSGDPGRGDLLYRRYCIGCHGRQGDGMGENAPYLEPPPRDFTAGVFKCRSTPTGSLPLDSDLFSTIGRGIYASAMPSWVALMPQQRTDLVAFIKTFSPRFQQEKPQAAVPIPPETPDSKESTDRGSKLYEKMECWKCHGQEGKGNGPSAATLTDSKEHRIVPYDFTTGERFKCGQTNEDLYRIFMTGLDGTPMPAYLDDLKPDQAWDLVHFLRTLQKPTR